MFRLILSSFFLAILLTGCSGIQESIDEKLAAETIGKSYQDIRQKKGLLGVNSVYGEFLLEKDLKDGSKLYLHVHTYVASKSGFGGVAFNNYKFRTWGFKVKDDIINDWAYGLYEPADADSTEILFFELGFDEEKWLKNIKDTYSSFMKTSKGDKIDVW